MRLPSSLTDRPCDGYSPTLVHTGVMAGRFSSATAWIVEVPGEAE